MDLSTKGSQPTEGATSVESSSYQTAETDTAMDLSKGGSRSVMVTFYSGDLGLILRQDRYVGQSLSYYPMHRMEYGHSKEDDW